MVIRVFISKEKPESEMHNQDSGKQRFRIYLANKGSSVALYIINIFNNFIYISRTIQKYKSVLVLSRILMCTVAQ